MIEKVRAWWALLISDQERSARSNLKPGIWQGQGQYSDRLIPSDGWIDNKIFWK